MMLHLTRKNWFVWVAGVCVVLLAAIAVLVPSDHWGLPPWKWIIFALVGLAIIGLTIQLFVQSREDQERELRDSKLDARQQGIEAKLTEITQLVSKDTYLAVSTSTNSIEPPLNPPVDFDASKYFRTAHQSAWTADVEKRIRIAAAQNKAYFTTEEFYSKFIGVGLVAYMPDITWAYIWKSQILMLAELNKQNGTMTLDAAKTFYTGGSTDYPSNYIHYSFDQWLGFMTTQGLIIVHPSKMLEITVRGRDFLSNMAHNSRTADQRIG
jgi:hypothetical protein